MTLNVGDPVNIKGVVRWVRGDLVQAKTTTDERFITVRGQDVERREADTEYRRLDTKEEVTLYHDIKVGDEGKCLADRVRVIEADPTKGNIRVQVIDHPRTKYWITWPNFTPAEKTPPTPEAAPVKVNDEGKYRGIPVRVVHIDASYASPLRVQEIPRPGNTYWVRVEDFIPAEKTPPVYTPPEGVIGPVLGKDIPEGWEVRLISYKDHPLPTATGWGYNAQIRDDMLYWVRKPEAPKTKLVPWHKAKGEKLPDGGEIIAVRDGDDGIRLYVEGSGVTHRPDADGNVEVLA